MKSYVYKVTLKESRSNGEPCTFHMPCGSEDLGVATKQAIQKQCGEVSSVELIEVIVDDHKKPEPCPVCYSGVSQVYRAPIDPQYCCVCNMNVCAVHVVAHDKEFGEDDSVCSNCANERLLSGDIDPEDIII